MKPYVWKKLTAPNEFRVLDLHGLDAEGSIQCSLSTVSTDDHPPKFTAISYHWGTGKCTEPVECNGQQLLVTKHVYALFKHILKRWPFDYLPRRIWIDAVCIDQTNKQERGQQVKLMKEIFSKPAFTIIYLGAPGIPDDMPALLSLINNILDLDNLLPERRKLKNDEFTTYGLPSANDKAWKLLLDLMCNPWFHRVWVIQEFVLSGDFRFLYGGEWLEWSHFVHTDNAVSSYHLRKTIMNHATEPVPIRRTTSFGGIFEVLSHYYMIRGYRHQDPDYYYKIVMDTIIWREDPLQSTDPRDYIFGMLGMLSPTVAQHPYLRPEYTASRQVVYTRFARFVMEQKGLCVLLSCAGSTGGFLREPSWLPDWSQPLVASSIPGRIGVAEIDGRRTLHTWRLEDGDLPARLFVKGVMLDEIVEVQALATSGSGKCNSVFQIAQLIMRSRKPNETTADMIARLTRILSTEHLTQTDWELVMHDLKELIEGVWPTYEHLAESIGPLRASTVDLSDTLSRVEAAGRELTTDPYMVAYRTRMGEVGRAPAQTVPGDIICFFEEVDVPYVLRKSEINPGEYLLLDHCFVEGKSRSFWEHFEGPELQEICLV